MSRLADLLDDLPAELARPVFTHASWSRSRGESYGRLAFLGDSVLSLSVTAHLHSRLEVGAFGAGELTKIRARAVSGRACLAVADRLGVPERLALAAPPAVRPTVPALARTRRVAAEVMEAVIGACYLRFGFERTAEAVVDAFAPEIEAALADFEDAKSALQEALARRGDVVDYSVADEAGPAHERTFEVVATVSGREMGRGRGRSKKRAEEAAARAALQALGEV